MPSVRTILSIAGVAAMAAATLAAPAAVSAKPVAKKAGLVVTHLRCVTTEDATGPDEPYLRWAGGNTIWGPSQLNDGQEVDLPHTAISVGDTIELWDQDSPDPDDLLGSLRIDGAHAYHFNNGADYWLTVENG